MCRLSELNNIPWLCGGDFNEIIENSEKLGGPTRNQAQMNDFKMTLDHSDLRDLGFFGSPWTWCNKVEVGPHPLVYVRLDRYVATPSWIDMFFAFRVQTVGGTRSDHLAIWIQLKFTGFVRKRRRPFKFEAMWTRHQYCE